MAKNLIRAGKCLCSHYGCIKPLTWILLACISFNGFSCKKFLEENSQNDFTPVTTASYSELLMGTGYPLVDGHLHRSIQLMNDDVQVYPPVVYEEGGNKSDLQGLPAYSWQPDFFQQQLANGFDLSGVTIDGYKNYYKLISGANIALQYTQNSVGSQEDKDYLLGQAYALRAYYYLQLVNLYGRPYNDSTTTPDKSLGVPLMLTANVSDKMPGRASVAAVYRQINHDLQSAFSMLDVDKRTGDVFRIDHISAHLLASRVNLYMCNFDSVIKDASYVIKYHPQLENLFDKLPLEYTNEGDYIGQPIVGAESKETIWSFGNMYDNFNFNLRDAYGMSEDLVSQFTATDLRAQVYFASLPPIFEQWVSILYDIAKWNGGRVSANVKQGLSFRSSEAYLNRAEAYAQKFIQTGDASFRQKSLNDLNTLRINRFSPTDFQPLTAMPAQELLKFCRNERRRELFQEGHRWFDLRRYGMPPITHVYAEKRGESRTYILQKHDPQYTLQIPPTAFLLNQNLVQNPAGPQRATQ